MTEKLVIQLLDESHGEEGAVRRRFRWGFIDELSDWPAGSHVGWDDHLLSSLAEQATPATLLVPGHRVVSQAAPYNKNEARHFLKLLPYEIEDDVLGSVEELHFAVGPKPDTDVDATIAVAYVDESWFADLFQWFGDNGITIEKCIADYQCLQAIENELLMWFTDGYVWGHWPNGLGFCVSQPLSQPFLKDVLLNQQDLENPWDVRVYVDDAETREIIESHILPPVDYRVIVGSPPLHFDQPNQLNFCSGRYGQKLPVDRWWQEAKPLAWLAAAAVAVFFVATFADVYLMKQQQAKYQEEMVAAYRTVVPRGPATDVVRRLKSKLGTTATVGEASQSVYLLAKVAPVLDQLKINLSALNYSQRDKSLRISINADSFNGIEQFRQQLDQQGVAAELQSSNAVDQGFQARLKITAKESRNG